MTDTWQDEYKQMVTDCLNRRAHLTDWELGFIESINAQLNAGKILTPKQIEKLDTVWENCTNEG